MILGKYLLTRVRQDRFLSNSLVFGAGSLLASAGNYFFHFLMARMLSLESYGELQSLIAISAIMGIPTITLLTVLIKYTAHFKTKEQLNKIYSLFLLFTKKVLVIAVGFLVIFCLLSKHMAGFLSLKSILPVIILSLGFLPSFLTPINNGILQGLQKFKGASVVSIIGASAKILLAVFLVKLGFGINGVMGAIVLSGLIGYFVALWILKFLFVKKKQELETKEIFQYFFPVLFTLLFTTLLYNIDIVLVKHFLPPAMAGEYGALTLIGHIIFFFTGPIVGVMFPMIVAAHSSNSDHTKVFKKSIFLVSLLGLGILSSYFLFPNVIIRVLVGSKFLSINKLLGWFGIAMFLYSLISLFSRYFLSIQKTRCFFLIAIGVLLQTVLIFFWHGNLRQIIWIMNITMFSSLVLLGLYYLKIRRKYGFSHL